MEEFKQGDIVLLKSGGPKMTVESAGDTKVLCVWHDKEKEVTIREDFPKWMIVKFDRNFIR